MMPASPPLPASQAGGAPDGDLCSGGVTRLSFPLDARGLGNRASRTGLHQAIACADQALCEWTPLNHGRETFLKRSSTK